MGVFEKELYAIKNTVQLIQIKNAIKDKVTDPQLRWDERMVLYQQVQMINDWIIQLDNKKTNSLELNQSVSLSIKDII